MPTELLTLSPELTERTLLVSLITHFDDATKTTDDSQTTAKRTGAGGDDPTAPPKARPMDSHGQ